MGNFLTHVPLLIRSSSLIFCILNFLTLMVTLPFHGNRSKKYQGSITFNFSFSAFFSKPKQNNKLKQFLGDFLWSFCRCFRWLLSTTCSTITKTDCKNIFTNMPKGDEIVVIGWGYTSKEILPLYFETPFLTAILLETPLKLPRFLHFQPYPFIKSSAFTPGKNFSNHFSFISSPSLQSSTWEY